MNCPRCGGFQGAGAPPRMMGSLQARCGCTGSVLGCLRCRGRGQVRCYADKLGGQDGWATCPLCCGDETLLLPLTRRAWEEATWEEVADIFDPAEDVEAELAADRERVREALVSW